MADDKIMIETWRMASKCPLWVDLNRDTVQLEFQVKYQKENDMDVSKLRTGTRGLNIIYKLQSLR